jgi:hypothetical protein
MFITYDVKEDRTYAKLAQSVRKGKKIGKKYKYLGLVINKDKNLFKNGKMGIFQYDEETDTYNTNPELSDEDIATIERLRHHKPKPRYKKIRKDSYTYGKLETAHKFNQLINYMIENNRLDELKQSTTDEAFQSKLISDLESSGIIKTFELSKDE